MEWRGRVPDRSLSISDSRLVSCKLDFPNESQMFDRPTILILDGNFTSSGAGEEIKQLLNCKSNNRKEIQDFANKEPFFLSFYIPTRIFLKFSNSQYPSSVKTINKIVISRSKDFDTRSYLQYWHFDDISRDRMSSIGFSLRRIYTNTRTNLSLSLSRVSLSHTMTQPFGSRENCREQLTSLIFITVE